MERGRYISKEFVHTIMETEKSYKLLSACWRPRAVGGSILSRLKTGEPGAPRVGED